MFKEFKEFAVKGNVLDLATAVILGAAFGQVVTSLVNDIIMPPIGLVLGKVDFSNLFFNLSSKPLQTVAEAKLAGVPTINYGLFANTLLNFVIVAFALFLIIKQSNRFKRADKTQAPVPNTKNCPYCITPIPLTASRCGHCTSQLPVV